MEGFPLLEALFHSSGFNGAVSGHCRDKKVAAVIFSIKSHARSIRRMGKIVDNNFDKSNCTNSGYSLPP